jgi:hypothetical protein
VDLSSTLSVKVIVDNEYDVTELNEATNATLVCDDGDIFNMYVKLTPPETFTTTDTTSTSTIDASSIASLTDEQLMALLSTMSS